MFGIMMEGRQKHVLLIDDSEAIQALVRHSLQAEELQLWTVGNESDACAMVQKRNFDLILLDIELERANGFEVLAKINGLLRKDDRFVPPILALSGHDADDFGIKVLQAGFTGRIRKPFVGADLRRIVRMHLLRTNVEFAEQ